MVSKDDTVDLREIARTLYRGKGWVLAGFATGLVAALLVILLLRPSYQATATALLGGESERTPSALAMLGGLADALPTGLAGGIETELQLLTSRAVYGPVVDSLFLQARVRNPRGVPAEQLFSDVAFERRLPEGSYTFQREGQGYAVRGKGHSGEARPGVQYELPGATVTLSASGDLPDRFEVELVSREEAIDLLQADLTADEAGGDVARLVYSAPDPVTAAKVPNLVIAEYLRRKRTTDRGVNQHRYEFLRSRADSVRIELAAASEQLRVEQERSGVFDPEVVGEAEVEGLMGVRGALEAVQVQLGGLERLLAQPNITGRQLAAFPPLLESPAVNELVALMAQTDAERETLLERRTPEDPEIVALARTSIMLESQLAELARDYLRGLRGQQAQLIDELAQYERTLAVLPAQARDHLQLRREVERLSQTELVLQTQLIDARLAAIGEGGNVRQIDVAVPPEEPNFPKPLPTLAVGLFGGLLLGVFSALGVGYLSSRVNDPYEAELIAGVPAVVFKRNAPLLIGGLDSRRTALVVPIGPGGTASAVAHQIAATSQLQGRRTAVVELVWEASEARAPGETVVPAAGPSVSENGSSALVPYRGRPKDGVPVYRVVSEEVTAERIRSALSQIEEQNDLVLAVAPGMEDIGTAALLSPDRLVILVGRLGEVSRSEIQSATVSLSRLGISVPGVVLTNGG